MGAGCSCTDLPDGPVKWFPPDSPDTGHWLAMTSLFGQGRTKSFRHGSMLGGPYNRKGNAEGELAGRVVFYTKADGDTDYSSLPGEPRIRLRKGVKLYAKAFFAMTLGRIPVGENNLLADGHVRGVKGHGPTLLAMVPRVCAIFIDVNDTPACPERFCELSAKEARKAAAQQRDRSGQAQDEGELDLSEKTVEGSFLTYLISRRQDDYSFMHFPLLASFHDCLFHTGDYGQTLVQAFYSLFSSMHMGVHKLSVRVHVLYDHSSFNYFPLDINSNACGKWHEGLLNKELKSPHRSPHVLLMTEQPMAQGSCFLDVPGSFRYLYLDFLDCKPPKEVYDRLKVDIEEMRAEAKSVAEGRFGKKLKVKGAPNSVVLTTDLLQRRIRDKETGYRYHYQYVEFTALWFSPVDMRPESMGYMVRGCMARGEVKPRRHTKTWTWHSLQDENHRNIEPPVYRIKNKYIRESNIQRRRGTWAAAIHKAALIGRISNEFMNMARPAAGAHSGARRSSMSLLSDDPAEMLPPAPPGDIGNRLALGKLSMRRSTIVGVSPRLGQE